MISPILQSLRSRALIKATTAPVAYTMTMNSPRPVEALEPLRRLDRFIHSIWDHLSGDVTPPPIRSQAPLGSIRRSTLCATNLPPHERATRGHPKASTPLRVWCVQQAGAMPGQEQLRMSGRMADVCAELERMASREARATQPMRHALSRPIARA